VENPRFILLFDGVCNLCNGFVQFVLKRNKRRNIVFGALQSESGQKILRERGLPIEEFESLIVLTDGKTFKKSQAFFALCAQLDFPWPLLCILRVIPRPLSDFIYDKIARSRYRIFGKRDVCMLPTEDIQDRFLP
jgi:predicted DCC family thiol-disulfide oxidoreductase YuxK